MNRLFLPTIITVLDSIRPDRLIYKSLGRCLVMWDEIKPTDEWIESQIPLAILNPLKNPKESIDPFPNKTINKLSQRSAFPLYICSIAGFCYGIGIIYAGTSDEVAMDTGTLLRKLKLLRGTQNYP